MDITASSVSISLDKNDLAEEMSMSFAQTSVSAAAKTCWGLTG